MAADTSFEELLRVSRNKRALGDTYAQVLSFLKGRGADENTIKDIVTILREDEKKGSFVKEDKKVLKEKKESFRGAVGGGLVLVLLGGMLLTGSLSILFGDIDPEGGYGKGRIGHLAFYILVQLEGTLKGYLLGAVMFLLGAWFLYKAYQQVSSKA